MMSKKRKRTLSDDLQNGDNGAEIENTVNFTTIVESIAELLSLYKQLEGIPSVTHVKNGHTHLS